MDGCPKTNALAPTQDHGQGVDFCLVVMPYAWPKMPSPAIGLLQAILERDGLTARSLYANIPFWDLIGTDEFELVSKNLESLYWAGSWTFAHVAFPDFHPDHDAFLAEVHRRCDTENKLDMGRFREIMFSIREAAGQLIDDTVGRILEMRARIVGCSITFQSQHVASLALLRRLRERAPEVVTMMGGSNCEGIMGLTTHRCFPWVDYVVSGEADDLIGPLTRKILEHGNRVPPADLPEAVFAPHHREEGYPNGTEGGPNGIVRATVASLENCPAPNYDDFFSAYEASTIVKEKIRPGLAYESSRGCWWGRCRFCGLNGCGTKYRSKPAQQVLRDLAALSKRYGLRAFETVDNIMDMDYFTSLLPELARRGAPYQIFYETKSSLGRAHFETLRKAGVRWIQPGVESLHSEMLKLMRKGSRAYQNIELLKWSRQYGIRMQWAILFDFPGEKDAWYEEMLELLPLLCHLNPPFGFVPIRYHRFSHYQEHAAEYSLSLRVPPMLRYVYPLADEELGNMVYDFMDENRETVKKNPLLAALLDRQSIYAIGNEIIRWINTFWSEKRPVLGMTVADSEIAIRDTRPVAVKPSYRLAGLERDVYLACEEAKKPSDLTTMLANNGVTEKQINAAVQKFVKHKLMLRIDGRLLGLAVREPFEEFLEDDQFPGGAVKGRCPLSGQEEGRRYAKRAAECAK